MRDSGTFICDLCGEVQPLGERIVVGDQHLCQNCYADHYTHCTRCGTQIRYEDCRYPCGDDEPYCTACYRNVMDGIHDYYFKPTPIFYGQGPRFFGVELEIDGAGEDRDNARELLGIANRENQLIYCKHDGSLDDGFEIVTHPMSLEFHQNTMPWAELLQEAISMGYTCQRQFEIVRKRRRNFVVFRRGGNKTKRFLAQKECSRFAVSGA